MRASQGQLVLSRGGCRRSARAALELHDRIDDGRDALLFRWTKGEATDLADFGDPLAATDYTFCLYGPAGEPILEAAAPAGGECGDKPCWKSRKQGFIYRDARRDSDGLRQVLLTAGEDGKAAVAVVAGGERLPLPPLGFDLPITAQLQAAGGECWEAVFDEAKRNDSKTLKAAIE